MREKILAVFESEEKRGKANFLELENSPFKVGHLDKPEFLQKAISKLQPQLVIFYDSEDTNWAFQSCKNLRKDTEMFHGNICIATPNTGAESCEKSLKAGASALILTSVTEQELIVRIASILNSAMEAKEYQRRSQQLARASAEAADIIIELEEAHRQIQEQNKALKLRDEKINKQTKAIHKHLKGVRHEMELAARLQISLMPSSREYSGWSGISLADRYIPAASLGGDYYDYVRLKDDSICICIADVTGHGVAPALVTVQLRALARSHLLGGQSLPAVLTDLNIYMYETFRQQYLMTMACMHYKPGESEIEFVGAGHCPLIHYNRASDECHEHFSKGLPLGVMAEAEFESSFIPFATDDRLLLYTDGITEACDGSCMEFSPERLIADFTQTCNESLEGQMDALINSVKAYTEYQPFADDVTMVSFERNDP